MFVCVRAYQHLRVCVCMCMYVCVRVCLHMHVAFSNTLARAYAHSHYLHATHLQCARANTHTYACFHSM